jgi:ElaB/YqjD/DUF883 family membrane-anchored ribosome-binding protein
VLNEEQLNDKVKRAKEFKFEIEHKEADVKRIFDNGNEMLKTSSGSGSVADLARNLMNLNTKWSSLCKRVQMRVKMFNDIEELVGELKGTILKELSNLKLYILKHLFFSSTG